MMLFEIILTLTCLSESIKSSIVIDSLSQNQKGVYLSDYCPKMRYCPEGAHVMCMYYNPSSIMGPRCHDPKNVTIIPELANKLLDVSNAVRSKIARGQEKGKNSDHFPRGYGIFRLKWDTELATFAQVLANQCVLRHDLCRASKRFPDPGQTAGLVRFSDPDWFPVSKSGNFTQPGLDNDKLMYAITQSLKSWYAQKSSVSVQMLTSYPDWDVDPHKTQIGRPYLEMIYGPSTHMGCGISAYNEYAFYDNNASLSYNTVHVICNYSGRPRTGGAVYNTVPPTDTASTFNQCGCPAGSIEDDDCLCHEVPKEQVPVSEAPLLLNVHKTRKCGKNMNCEPTVVLLPIFTVEDAPPDTLIYSERFPNATFDQTTPDSFEELIDNNISGNTGTAQDAPAKETLKNTVSNVKNQRPPPSHYMSVRHRHFDNPNDRKNQETLKEYEDRNTRKSMSDHNVPRGSIFAKTPRFELPGARMFLKIGSVPRKEFSKGQKLVGKYLYNKKNIVLPKEGHSFNRNYKNPMSDMNEVNSVEMVNHNHDLQNYLHPKVYRSTKNYHKDVQFNDILTTETILNTAEQRVINHNDHMKDLITHDYDKVETKTTTEENDKKLMALLDTLEQEVKHIELRDKEKQIFDTKIKKIYGKVVGDPRKILDSNEIKYETKREPKRETTRKTKYETRHETKPETKVRPEHETLHEPKQDPKHDPKDQKDGAKHESTHEPTHLDLDMESNGIVKESKDHDNNPNKEHDNTFEDDNSVHYLEPSHDKLRYENDNSRRDPHYTHDLETEGFENYPTHDAQSNELESDDFNKRQTSKHNKIMSYKKGDKSFFRRKQNIRQRNMNDIDSLEYFRHQYENGYRERKSFNNNRHFERNMRNGMEKPKHRSNSLDRKLNRRSYSNDGWYDDPLSAERRKYYQDKLDDMERRLLNIRHSVRVKDANRPRHMRAMRPSMRSDNQMDPLYTAGRGARFLHGY